MKQWQVLGFPSPQSYAARVGANKRRIAAINARLDELGWYEGGYAGQPERDIEEGERLATERDALVDQIAPITGLFDAMRRTNERKARNVTDRETLQVGDWVRCLLPRAATCYGDYARVLDLRTDRPDKGIQVAFPPIQVAFPPRHPGHKPMRMTLSDGHWSPAKDVVTRLAITTLDQHGS